MSSRGTSTGAQEQRIIQALRRGPKTTDQLRALGCYQVSARIFGLRRKNFLIHTELFNGYAVDSFHHARMARYTLLSEPGRTVRPPAPRKPGGGLKGKRGGTQ